MSAVIIHTGLHKAASTWLQKVWFPAVTRNYHKFGREELDALQQAKGYDPQYLKNIITRFTLNDAEPVILSHEELSGHPHGYEGIDPEDVIKNIGKSVPEAKIIFITRNQKDYMNSLYTYRVSIKGMESRPILDFLYGEFDLGLRGKMTGLGDLAESYVKKFGKKNVLALPVELLKTDRDAFLSALAEFIGIAPPDIEDRPQKANISIKKAGTLERLAEWNEWFQGVYERLNEAGRKPLADFLRLRFYDFKKFIAPQLEKWDKSDGKITVPDTIWNDILPDILACNDKLQSLCAFDLEELGYDVGLVKEKKAVRAVR